MKQVILQSIALRDWKSLNVSVEFNQHGATTIQGRNGIGKSSIYHAWLWLLTGYIVAGENKNADLYDHRFKLTPDTPTASVKAILLVDGEQVMIERTAKSKFVRKRGTDIFEKAPSDEYKLYVDNIETSIGGFEDTIKGLFGVPSSLLPYILSGEFFSFLASQDMWKARALLEDMTREIPIEEMTDKDYSPLKIKLEKYSIEQLKEQNANSLAPLKQREHDIPIKIEEKQKLIAEYRENDFVAIAKEIESCKNSIKSIDDEMMGTKASMEAKVHERNEAIKKRGDIMALIEDKRRAYDKTFQEEVDEINKKITDLKSQNSRFTIEREDKMRLIESKRKANKEREASADKMEAELQVMRDNLVTIKNRAFDEANLICKYCGQPLPEKEQEEMRLKFEAQKEKDKEDNISKGKAKKAELENLKETITSCNTEIESLQQEYDSMPRGDDNTEIEMLEKQKSDARASHTPFSETDEYKGLIKEHDAIEVPATETDANAETRKKEKSELMDKFESLNRKYGLLTEVEKMEKEIHDLENEKEEVGRHIVQIEQFQALIEAFEEEKARRVSEQINGRMEGCMIRMWRIQKDGQRTKDCVITNGEGVGYSTTNFSDRIRMNMQLQRLFCDNYGILPPTFVDEAYAFDSWHEPKAWHEGQQMILLSPSDDNFMNVQHK